jgi:competence protein ComEA
MLIRRKLLSLLFALLFVASFSIPSFAADVANININTASIEELTKLDKIGEAYAKRIVEYREANGQFEKAEDIMKVKGIGQKIWELNKDRIVVK